MYCVYNMFTLHVFLACFCGVYILIVFGPLEGGVIAQNRHNKPLTLGTAHAACLCGEDAFLDGAPTLCIRCTCLYSVASSRGTHDGVNKFV